MSRSRSSAYHSERVIVLGAGMSGLACARELQNRGYEVLVVEARGRVGGRLKGGSVNLANRQEPQETAEDHGGRGKHKAQQMEQPTQQQQHLVDLGGALIHGVDDNPLSRLVQDMGITTQPVQECLLFQNGWPIDPRDDARISTVFNDCLEESFQRCQDRVDDGASFGVVFQQVCRERSVNSSNPVFLWHKANLEVSCGASLEDLGWRWNEDEQYGYDGDHVAVRQSWKAVVDGLAEGLDILYDAPVSRVHVVHPAPVKAPSPKPEPHSSTAPSAGPIPSTSALKATSSSKQGSASKRRRGAILDFSAAAVAVSARKSRRLLNLDADARRSSRANLGKEVERYKAEPSSSSPRRKRAVGAKPEPLLLRPKKHTVVQVTLQSGRVLESDFVVCTLPLAILQTDTVRFDPPLPPRKQQAIHRLGAGLLNKCVLSFSHVFWQESDFMGLAGLDDEETPYLILNGHAYLGQPILAFLYGGSHAKRVEDWTDAETIADCVRVLKKICGRQIPHPVDYRMTRWGHEQYSRMAFTYIPPGVDGFQELQAMSEPVYDHTGTKPTLMFAGEHTSVFHPSTIHGAFLSGIREAYRLDLALFPQANDGLEFSDSELYERTFDVRRRYFESSSRSGKHESKTNEKNKEDKVGIPKNRKQHRRRGAAGVMTLRKRPNPSKTSAAINGTVPASPSVSGARKSPRAPAVFNVEDAPDRDSSAPALWLLSDLSEKPNMASLDDLTLLRGLESYGSNYEYLLAMVLPVQLDDSNLSRTQQLSLPQLRKRCQMLLPTLRSLKAMSTPSWKRWVAKTVFSPTSGDPNSLPASDKNANESAPPRIPNPKPTTSLNSGATSDSGNRPPPAEIRTRLGRLVRSPSLTSRSSIGDIDGPTVSCYWSQSGSRTITEEARARHTVPAHTSTKTRFGRLVKRPEG